MTATPTQKTLTPTPGPLYLASLFLLCSIKYTLLVKCDYYLVSVPPNPSSECQLHQVGTSVSLTLEPQQRTQKYQ